MRRLAVWLVVSCVSSVSLVSCGSAGTVNPATAKVEDLVGWWRYELDDDRRVFGFVAPPDGPWSVPVSFAHRDQPLSTIYQGPAPLIRSSFEVKDGVIVETVIDSIDFDPGKQFSTKILSLVKGQSLTLEAQNAPGGSRTWAWHERCAMPLATGWSAAATLNYPSYFATASTMAFDSKGRLHTFTGMAGEQGGAVPARPTYSVLDKGCEASWFSASNARAATLVVDASDVVHLFWTESAVYSEGPDGTLMHKFRHTDSEQWTTETLSTLQTPLTFKAATRGPRLVLVTQRANVVEVADWRDGAWNVTVATINGTVPGALNGASIDPSGRLWLSLGGRLLREVSAATFEVLAAPPAPLILTGDFYVDGAGRAHHFIGRGPDGLQHGIYENDAWRFLPAPHGEGFVRVDAPPWKYFNVTTHPFPYLALATQSDTGVNTYEFVNARSYNPNTATVRGVAVASDGTIAVSETGENVSVKRPVAPWGQVPTVSVTLTIGGSGAGRVWSDDGRIDCSATCTVELPAFSRHRVHTDPAPNNVLSKSSGERDDFATRFTWLNIGTNAAQFTENPNNQFTFEFARSLTPEVIPLSPPTGGFGTVSRWDARGASIAVSSTTTGGKVFFRDAEVTAAGSGAGEVLVLSEGGGAPVAKRLPAIPTALGVSSAGGARGVFFANRALTFEGTTLGAAAAPLVLLVSWDSALAQGAVETLATLPANSLITAAALDPAGAVAVLVENDAGFPALGANVRTALVWRSAAGPATVVPFEANVLLASPRLSLRGSVLLISSGSSLWVYDDGVRTGTRTVSGGEVSFGVVSLGSAVQALVTATSGGVDFGGGSLNPTPGDQYLVSWGFDGAHLTSSRLQPAFTRVFASAVEPRGLLVLDQPTTAGPYLFLAGQNVAEPLVKTPTQVRALSAQGDGEGLWVLVQQQAAQVDYGVATIDGAGRQVLVKAVLP